MKSNAKQLHGDHFICLNFTWSIFFPLSLVAPRFLLSFCRIFHTPSHPLILYHFFLLPVQFLSV